jgi:hypothetical protein
MATGVAPLHRAARATGRSDEDDAQRTLQYLGVLTPISPQLLLIPMGALRDIILRPHGDSLRPRRNPKIDGTALTSTVRELDQVAMPSPRRACPGDPVQDPFLVTKASHVCIRPLSRLALSSSWGQSVAHSIRSRGKGRFLQASSCFRRRRVTGVPRSRSCHPRIRLFDQFGAVIREDGRGKCSVIVWRFTGPAGDEVQ